VHSDFPNALYNVTATSTDSFVSGNYLSVNQLGVSLTN
jgi:hypothetical protein